MLSDTLATQDIGSGLCLVGGSNTLRPVQVAVSAHCSGPIAAVHLTSRFVHSGAGPEELVYVFALGEDASLVHFRAQVGGRRLQGQVQPLSACRAEELAFQGDRPLFLCRLGLVEPGQEFWVELAYGELIACTAGRYRWSFPTHGAGTAVKVSLEGAADVRSSSPCRMEPRPGGELGLEVRDPGPGFFVEYGDDSTLPWMRHDARHFLLKARPPEVASLPRDLVLLLDLSHHSADGAAALAGATRLLQGLEAHERFALVCFQDDFCGYQEGRLCDAGEKDRALAWLTQQRPRGRAQLATLWNRLLSLPSTPGRSLVAVLVAAGPLGNETGLFAELCTQGFAGRIFATATGPQAPKAFLRSVALRTRGACFSSGSWDELSAATRSPFLGDLQHQGIVAGSCQVEWGNVVLGLRAPGQLEMPGVPGRSSGSPTLGTVWASRKVRALEDEISLSSGPRASQLRQIVRDLALEYRLLSGDTRLVIQEEGRAEAWTVAPWTALPGRQRVRLHKHRLAPPTRNELVSEPPRVKAALIPARVEERCPKPPRKLHMGASRDLRRPLGSKPALPERRSPQAVARTLLRADGPSCAAMMQDMRVLFQSLDRLAPQERQALLGRVLTRLQPLAARSALLAEALLQGRRIYQTGAAPRVREWVKRLAQLF